MEEWIRPFVINTSVLTEGAAALIIALAVLRSIFVAFLGGFFGSDPSSGPLRLRLRLGRWLALALEFLVAADILRTAVAPTWNEIGQLAAIVLLRTVLNYFLEREIRAGQEDELETPGRAPDRTQIEKESAGDLEPRSGVSPAHHPV